MHPSINNTISISHVIVFLHSKGVVCGMESEVDAKRQLAVNTEYWIRGLPYDESLHSDRVKVTRTAQRLSVKLLDRGYVKLANDYLGHGWSVTRKGLRFAKKAARAAAKDAEKQARRANLSRSTFIVGSESFQR